MNRLLAAVGVILVLIAGSAECYLLWTYWSKITDVTLSDKNGPLIQSIFTPLVAVITIIFSFIVISVQFNRNRELERVKQRLGEVYKRQSDAYFRMWNAVSVAYRLLSELQGGTFPAASRSKIETAFSEAEPYVFVATNAHRDLFYNYWQYVVEMMAKADAAGNPAAKRALWTADGPQLGNRRTESGRV
jgi:hypothetical protein